MSHREFYSLNCRGRVLSLDRPRIMGILNITPDSFSDGGRYQSVQAAVDQAGNMLLEGADVIDIGGYSSRPGAEDIEVSVEIDRILPVIDALRTHFPDAFLSVDTFRSPVAAAAYEAGVHIINDISGGELDPQMIPLVASWKNVPYILMHMQGTPQTMQQNPSYTEIVEDIWVYFVRKVAEARAAGMMDVVLDPGFGFGKTIDHNFMLLAGLGQFRELGLPVLAGLSRKSMIYKLIGGSPDESDAHSQILHDRALQQGAHILRVHNVAAARKTIILFERMNADGTI